MRVSPALVLLGVALAVLLLQVAPPAPASSTTSVRFRVASDVNVTVYRVGALVGYYSSLAVFARDGVLYAAYDNLVNGSNIVRVDTGEVVKTCSFSDYAYFDSIVAGRGTAYGVMGYWVSSTEWGRKIIDLWNCRVLAVFEKATSYFTRGADYLFRYDMYSDKLLYAFFVYNETVDAELNYVALIDVATREVKLAYFGVRYSFSERKRYATLTGLYAGPDYYYIVTETSPTTVTMHIYDKNLEHLVGTMPWDPNAERVPVWYGSSDLAVNAYGVLQHKYVLYDWAGNYWLKLVMRDALLSEVAEYATDADGVPSNFGGVAAYRSIFVFHNGKSGYSVWGGRVPFAFIFFPNIGLAVNTSIAGFAVPVGYELWSANRIALFNPATGDLYVVYPPAADYTVIEYTVTETATITVTRTATATVTVTEPPPIPSVTVGVVQMVLLLVLVAAIASIVGFVSAIAGLALGKVSPGSGGVP